MSRSFLCNRTFHTKLASFKHSEHNSNSSIVFTLILSANTPNILLNACARASIVRCKDPFFFFFYSHSGTCPDKLEQLLPSQTLTSASLVPMSSMRYFSFFSFPAFACFIFLLGPGCVFPMFLNSFFSLNQCWRVQKKKINTLTHTQSAKKKKQCLNMLSSTLANMNTNTSSHLQYWAHHSLCCFPLQWGKK